MADESLTAKETLLKNPNLSEKERKKVEEMKVRQEPEECKEICKCFKQCKHARYTTEEEKADPVKAENKTEALIRFQLSEECCWCIPPGNDLCSKFHLTDPPNDY